MYCWWLNEHGHGSLSCRKTHHFIHSRPEGRAAKPEHWLINPSWCHVSERSWHDRRNHISLSHTRKTRRRRHRGRVQGQNTRLKRTVALKSLALFIVGRERSESIRQIIKSDETNNEKIRPKNWARWFLLAFLVGNHWLINTHPRENEYCWR